MTRKFRFDMKMNILLHTTDYRGDHSAEVCSAQEILHQETVEQLAERILSNKFDWIEIRKIEDAQPMVKPTPF